jgi:hypothetical protein
MTFSESMRAAAEDTWNAALDHRFFREVATDAIEDRAFERYLRVEYGFVDCAAIVMGYAVAKAPSFVERVSSPSACMGWSPTSTISSSPRSSRSAPAPIREPACRRMLVRLRFMICSSIPRGARDTRKSYPAFSPRSGCI